MNSMLLAIAVAAAGGDTAAGLYSMCNGEALVAMDQSDQALEKHLKEDAKMYCLQYVRGVVDAAGLYGDLFGVRMFCLPGEGIRADALVGLFSSWMDTDKTRGGKSPRDAIVMAMIHFFPCQADPLNWALMDANTREGLRGAATRFYEAATKKTK